jgi:hypothetical protein
MWLCRARKMTSMTTLITVLNVLRDGNFHYSRHEEGMHPPSPQIRKKPAGRADIPGG